jgi:hypothetical protein
MELTSGLFGMPTGLTFPEASLPPVLVSRQQVAVLSHQGLPGGMWILGLAGFDEGKQWVGAQAAALRMQLQPFGSCCSQALLDQGGWGQGSMVCASFLQVLVHELAQDAAVAHPLE